MTDTARRRWRELLAIVAALLLASPASATGPQVPDILLYGLFGGVGGMLLGFMVGGWLYGDGPGAGANAAFSALIGLGAGIVVVTVASELIPAIQRDNAERERERRAQAFDKHPVVVHACAGDVAALKAALTDAAIRDPETRLHSVIDVCLFGAANPHAPQSNDAPAPAAPRPAARADTDASFPPAPDRLPVLAPLAAALLRMDTLQAGSNLGGRTYCSYLQQWHREHHVFVLRALHADGLPLDCAGGTRAWWQGLTAKASDRLRRERMFMWLGALAEMRFDFGQQGCESAPCRGTRTALDREIDARDLPLLRFLLLAGVDPTTVDGTRSNPQSAYSVWLTRSSPAREPEVVALSAAEARARMLADIDEEENALAQQARDAAQAKVDADVEACREKVIGSRNYVIAGGQDRCVDILGVKEYSRLRGAPPGVQMMRPKP